ncbi:MAG: DUF1552 domain-containing protein [Myxococcota bacterium]
MPGTLGRRSFVSSMAAATLLSPFISLLGPRRAIAAGGKAKYLLIFHTTGTMIDQWTPTGSTESDIVFSPMLEPLEPLRDSLVVIDELDSKGTSDNHAAPGGLTGVGHSGSNRVSLEQFVGDKLAQQGVSTPFENLILGGVSSEAQSTFFRYSDQALSPLFSPAAAYETIFAGIAGGGDLDGEAAERLLARRQSSLDLITSEISELSDQLGHSERQKLELHTDSIRQLEDRLLGNGDGPECNPAGGVTDSPEALVNSATHVELAITAFSCDLTRVAAIEFGHHQATQVGLPEIGTGDWHQFIHGGQTEQVVNLERWVGEQFVAAAEQLRSMPAPDGDGSLFDQTLMIWTRGMGDAVAHNGSNMRFVLSGGAGGYLKTAPGGRYLQGGGEAHQRVLFNCCEAMGITDLEGFGSTESDAGAREPLSILCA